MEHDSTQVTSIDAYIARAPEAVQGQLEELRATIRAAAPEATEKISYQMPTFALQGNLVHFAAFRNHIGFYPGGACVERFRDRLAGYETSKGTIRIPIGRPLPLDLVRDIVLFRVEENLARAAAKAAAKKRSQ